MSSGIDLADRERDLSWYAAFLSVDVIADRLLVLVDEINKELDELPWWALRRRRTLKEWEAAAVRLYFMFGEYSRDQKEAMGW